MRKTKRRSFLIAALFPAIAVILFRTFPPISALWTAHIIRPAGIFLNKLTAKAAFPIAEMLSAAVAVLVPTGCLASLARSLAAGNLRPLTGWGLRVFSGLLAVIFAYVFLWYPAYWALIPEPAMTPEIHHIAWLCKDLIESLNASPLRFPTPEEVLDRAPQISGIPDARVKAARYPEWMRRLHIAGLYVPWTGEAIVDPDAPPCALPFTAVHELMHLNATADEGSANIAAWEACKQAGGYFYDSARLWVLKYAMETLSEQDPDAAQALYAGMSPDLFRTFSCMNGRTAPANRCLSILTAALGLSYGTSSYPRLVNHVCAGSA